MRQNPKAMMVIVAAAALIGVSGCGASGTGGQGAASSQTSSSAPSGTTQSLTITIKDFGYQGPVSVSPGAKITVKNEDTQAHTVTSDDGKAFDAAVDGGGGGGTAQFTAPTSPGSYPYHCAYHSNMHGTLVVK